MTASALFVSAVPQLPGYMICLALEWTPYIYICSATTFLSPLANMAGGLVTQVYVVLSTGHPLLTFIEGNPTPLE